MSDETEATSVKAMGIPTTDLLSDLLEVWRKRKATPILIAVWCVDRPDALWRMRQLLHTDKPSPMAFPFATQVPVYEWYSRYADAEDWARRPECFKTPGVYMQMSDGTYTQVQM